jgi:hypothetical protein
MSGLKERLMRLRQMAAETTPDNGDASGQTAAADAGGRLSGDGPRPADDHVVPLADDLCDAERTGAENRLHPAFVQIGVREIYTEAGSFLLRETWYPLDYRHGQNPLGELAACAPQLGALCGQRRTSRHGRGRQSGSAPLDSRPPQAAELLFLDTETTGLGVGTGNLPFMIGLGRWTPEGLAVRQSLIRHPGEERAMLTWLAEQFQGVTHIATYNGKSFDWPLLESRFILNGWRRKGPAPAHLDLLHPARALWKTTLPTCRLGTVEEMRLGIVRDDDMPGALAPALYMRYLQDGDPAHLHGVFLHNERDILTLVALAIHFGQLLGGGAAGEIGASADGPVKWEAQFRIGLWLERQGRVEAAREIYDMLSLEVASAFEDRHADLLLALAGRCKHLGLWHRALPLWKLAAAHAENVRLPGATAHLELAMYYEHRERDLASALHYAEQGLALAVRRQSAMRTSDAARQARAMWEHRIRRLQRKMAARSFAGAQAQLHWTD